MKQAVHKSNERQRAEAAKSTANRKKVMVVFILFLVMAALWIKAFMGKGKPKAASAAVDASLLNAAAESAGPRVVYTELPVVSQRHDVLGNDFFSAQNLSEFRKKGESVEAGEVDVTNVPGGQGLDGLETAAKEMELLAIVNDEKSQVFIEDKLLEEGQSFKFESYGEIYEFKVINIMENGVELECNGITITKKIPEPFLQAE